MYDYIHKYFPDFPDYGAPLTIRNFIHHTSGVRDYLTLMSLKNRSYLDEIQIEEVYDLIKSQKTLNFTPGDRYLYSNSCYFMLALIVEKASGKSIREFGREEIFQPLGMSQSLFYDDNTDIIKNRAFSYQKTPDGWNNLINRFQLVGSGGVYSTVEDLVKWDQNFYEIIDKMHQVGLLNDGRSSGYAFALRIGTYKGLPTVYHSGSLAGYRSVQLRFPDQQFTITILANRNDASTLTKAYKIADVYLKELMTEEALAKTTPKAKKKVKPIKLSEKKITPYAGFYWNSNIGIKAEIEVEDGKLVYSDPRNLYKLEAIDQQNFIVADDPSKSASFSLREDGEYNMELTTGNIKYHLTSYQMVNYSMDDLKKFTGKWYSDELDFNYSIKLEEGNLILYMGRVKDDVLELIKKNTFRAGTLIIDFDEDQQSFALSAGRVKNLKFVRQ